MAMRLLRVFHLDRRTAVRAYYHVAIGTFYIAFRHQTATNSSLKL